MTAAVDVPGAVRLLDRAARIVLTSHRNPDGDAVGSVLGLAHVLRARGKTADCFFPDGIPESFFYLEGAKKTVAALPAAALPYDLAVALDCGSATVLPKAWPGAAAARGLLVIDHHPTRSEFGEWNLVQDAECVGQIVVRIADEMGYALDRALAECVYASLASDTGFFKYPGVKAETFELAARLLRAGVSPWKAAYRIDEDYPATRLQMLSEVLGKVRMSSEGRVAMVMVPPDLLPRLGLRHEHLENVINFARGIRGVEVAAQCRRNEEGKTRVSLRSRGRVDVAALARVHGGGGHHNAAGCTLDEPLDEAAAIIEADAAKAIEALGPLDPDDDGFFDAH